MILASCGIYLYFYTNKTVEYENLKKLLRCKFNLNTKLANIEKIGQGLVSDTPVSLQRTIYIFDYLDLTASECPSISLLYKDLNGKLNVINVYNDLFEARFSVFERDMTKSLLTITRSYYKHINKKNKLTLIKKSGDMTIYGLKDKENLRNLMHLFGQLIYNANMDSFVEVELVKEDIVLREIIRLKRQIPKKSVILYVGDLGPNFSQKVYVLQNEPNIGMTLKKFYIDARGYKINEELSTIDELAYDIAKFGIVRIEEM